MTKTNEFKQRLEAHKKEVLNILSNPAAYFADKELNTTNQQNLYNHSYRCALSNTKNNPTIIYKRRKKNRS